MPLFSVASIDFVIGKLQLMRGSGQKLRRVKGPRSFQPAMEVFSFHLIVNSLIVEID